LTVADEEKLKLGKGVTLVKSRLKRLPQSDNSWGAVLGMMLREGLSQDWGLSGVVRGQFAPERVQSWG